MKIEEMQNEWQMVKSSPRSHGEFRKMMYASPIRRMRRMQWKEKLSLSQTLVAFVVVIWVTESLKAVPTAVLACWLLYALLDEYLGLRYFSLLPNKATVHKTLTNSLSKLEDALILSRVIHLALWLAATALLNVNMQLGWLDTLFTAVILLPIFFLFSWLSSRKWSAKVEEVKAMLREVDGDALDVADLKPGV